MKSERTSRGSALIKTPERRDRTDDREHRWTTLPQVVSRLSVNVTANFAALSVSDDAVGSMAPVMTTLVAAELGRRSVDITQPTSFAAYFGAS